jgi:hypothetical protein
MYPGTSNVYLTPGQEVYNSLTNAQLGISIEAPIIDPLFVDATLRAYLIVKQGTISLQDEQNVFVTASKFGEPMAGGSTGGDVIGPAISLNNSIARFDGTTGKIIKDNTSTFIDDNGQMTIASLSGIDNKFIISNTAGMLLSSSYTIADAADWSSALTTVNTNSATTWNYQGTDLKALSASWSSVYTNVNSNSATWNSDYTTTNANSANWGSVYTSVNNASAEWVGGNSAYTTVNANSATTWNYQGTDLKALSAGWTSAETVVETTSGNWNSNYTTVNSNSANWNTAYDASSAVYRQATNASFAAATPIGDITGVTITVPTNGVYLISLTCTAVGSSNPTTGYIILNVNGSDVAITQRDYARGNQALTSSLAVTYIATLTASQIVKARALESAGTLVLTNVVLNIVRL